MKQVPAPSDESVRSAPYSKGSGYGGSRRGNYKEAPPTAAGMKIVAAGSGGLCTHNIGDEVTTVFDKRIEIWAAVVLIPVSLAAAGCTRTTSAAGPPRPPEVEVAAVQQRDVPVYREWIGTLDGMVNAAIRAEVTGYLLSRYGVTIRKSVTAPLMLVSLFSPHGTRDAQFMGRCASSAVRRS